MRQAIYRLTSPFAWMPTTISDLLTRWSYQRSRVASRPAHVQVWIRH